VSLIFSPTFPSYFVIFVRALFPVAVSLLCCLVAQTT
jgi:hypothetical protein